MPLYASAGLYWLVLFGLAAFNGALREFVLTPRLGVAVARPLSAITLIALLAIAIAFFVRWQGPLQQAQSWIIGAGWLAVTLIAEVALTIRSGKPAANVLAAFSWDAINSGEWVAFAFLFVAVAPAFFSWLLSR